MEKLALIAFALGFMLGAIIWDVLWRWARRFERKLIDEQRKLIDRQSHTLEFVHKVLSERESDHA